MLLFWNGKSADDKAVHDALDEGRPLGRPRVRRLRVDQEDRQVRPHHPRRRRRAVADHRRSPTTELRAETLVGYVDATTIDQAVVDAFRNTTGLFTDAYLKQVDKVCIHHSQRLGRHTRAPDGGAWTCKKVDARIEQGRPSGSRGFVADFKAVKAPKKWRAFQRARRVADLETVSAGFTHVSASLDAEHEPRRVHRRRRRPRDQGPPGRQARRQAVQRAEPVPLRLAVLSRTLDSLLVESLREHLEHPAGRGLRPAGAHRRQRRRRRLRRPDPHLAAGRGRARRPPRGSTPPAAGR